MKIGEYLRDSNKIDTAIISHKNCPDGSAAVVIAKKLFPEIKVFCLNHQKVNEQTLKIASRLKEKGKLFIVDIAPNDSYLQQTCDILKKKDAFLGVYDHHNTTEWLKDFNLPNDLNGEIIFDLSKCGAKIFFEKFYESNEGILQEYIDFINVVNDRDLWLQKDNRSKDLAQLFQILGEDKYINRFYHNSSLTFEKMKVFY